MKMTNAIESASRMVAQLERQKAQVEQQLTGLAEERGGLSFKALAGDAKATKRLAALNAQTGAATLELENVNSAIAEARRRVETAEREAAEAATRVKAREILQDADEMERLAAEVDAGLVGAATTIADYLMAADRLSRCGVRAAPNYRLVQLAVARAISTHLRGPLHGLIELPMVAPGQRRPLAETSGVPIRGLRDWARAVLGDVTAAELPDGDAMRPDRSDAVASLNS